MATEQPTTVHSARLPSDKPKEMTPEQAEKKAAMIKEKKARIAQVLYRGITNEKLSGLISVAKEKDSSRHYCFIRDEIDEIVRLQPIGFQVERAERLGIEGLHGTGDGRIRVGDVIMMSCPLEDYELIQEVERESLEKKLNQGKRDYVRNARQLNPEVPIFNPSGVGEEGG